MRQIDREDDVEKINRIALKMARKVADDTGTLMAGNICSSKIYSAENSEKERKEIWDMLEEQVCHEVMIAVCSMCVHLAGALGQRRRC